MKEILKALEIKGQSLDEDVLSLRIFSDESGAVLDFMDEVLFDFEDLNELKEFLNI